MDMLSNLLKVSQLGNTCLWNVFSFHTVASVGGGVQSTTDPQMSLVMGKLTRNSPLIKRKALSKMKTDS